MKTCSKCGVEKPLDGFGKKSRAKDGKRPDCRACQKIEAAAYRSENRKMIAAKRSMMAPTLVQYYKEYRAKNRERLLVLERAAKAIRPSVKTSPEYAREWQRKNIERIRPRRIAAAAHRRATLLRATPPWANLDAINLWYVAAKIAERDTGVRWHVDHIVPLRGRNVCGLHVENNLQLLPATMNQAKGNRLPAHLS